MIENSITLAGPGHTPKPGLPPLGEGPRRKMLLEIEVSADFEKRLDNQWMIEREIHADRYTWRWSNDFANEPEPCTEIYGEREP